MIDFWLEPCNWSAISHSKYFFQLKFPVSNFSLCPERLFLLALPQYSFILIIVLTVSSHSMSSYTPTKNYMLLKYLYTPCRKWKKVIKCKQWPSSSI